MKYVSLFSGIGGFDLAFTRSGMECVGVCEIDKQCQDVLSRRFPNVPIYDDVKKVGVEQYGKGTVDLVCGGFPCQDVSVAGKREGLAGERSGLWFEFARIINELKPRWVVVENVPGLLSSHEGKDFALVIGGLTGVVPSVPKDGWKNAGIAWGYSDRYAVAWRVLDAQYFGVPQRRRRVFIVGSLGSGSAAQVLFESEGLPGDTPPSREAGKEVAYSLRSNPSHSGDKGDGEINTTLINLANSGANQNNVKETDVMDTLDTWSSFAVARSLTSSNQRNDLETENFIADVAPTLEAEYFTKRYSNQQFFSQNGDGFPITAFMAGQGTKAGSIAASETTSPTLKGSASGTNQVPTIAFTPRRTEFDGMEDCSQTLNTGGGGMGSPAVAYGIYDEQTPKVSENVMPTLRNREEGGGFQQAVGGSFGIRRLTPTECARLQGFPDDWNDWLPDTVRYRQFGNAVAVPVVEWIGKRIIKASE